MTPLTFFLILVFLIILTVLSLGPALFRMTQDFAEPGVWFALFYFAHFAVRAVYDIIYGSELLDMSAAEIAPKIPGALVVAIIGLLAFWLGYFGLTHGYQREIDIKPHLPAEWQWQRAIPVALGCLAIGWSVKLLMMYVQAGGIVAWIVMPKSELLYMPGLAYVKLLHRNFAVAGIVILFIAGRTFKTSKYYYLMAPFLLLEISFRFVNGKRQSIFFFLLILLAAYYMTSSQRDKLSPKLTAQSTVLLAGLVTAFPLINRIRYNGLQNIGQTIAQIPSMVTDVEQLFRVVAIRLNGLDSIIILREEVPGEVPYNYFSELGLIPVSVIPRAIWADKPLIRIGLQFNHTFIHANPERGIVATMPGMFYWDLGIVGVLIGMVFLGVLWRLIYEYFVRPQDNTTTAFVTAMVFPAFFKVAEVTLVSVFTWYLFDLAIVLAVAACMFTDFSFLWPASEGGNCERASSDRVD